MQYILPKEKVCSCCKCLKKISEFHLRKTFLKDGLSHRPRSKCKACDRNLAKQYVELNRDNINSKKRIKREEDSKNINIDIYLKRRHTKWPFLTIEYLKQLYTNQKGLCFYTHLPLEFHINNINPNGISLDRLDPKLGYIPGNVVFCLFRINTMKGSLTYLEFIEEITNILNFHQGS